MKICFISLSQYPYINSVTSNLFCGNKGKNHYDQAYLTLSTPIYFTTKNNVSVLFNNDIYIANGYTDLIQN